MKKILFTVISFCLALMMKAQRVIPMPELIKPDSISIDRNQIYITEDITISIYNLKDFALKKKFGKVGEGPAEFMRNLQTGNPPLTIYISSDYLLVNSLNKVSFFSKEGLFKEERKVLARGDKFQPLANGFVGEGDLQEESVRYITINIYDSNLKKMKEVSRVLHPLQRIGAGFRILNEPRRFSCYQDRLFVTLNREFIIMVFDSQGNPVNKIDLEYSRKKVSPEDRERIDQYLKNHPRIKEMYSLLKPIHFPEFYPAIRDIRIVDDKIYVISWKISDKTTECMILDLKGKFIGQTFIPLKYVDELEIYPFAIRSSRLYQLVENKEWELHIIDIK